MGTGVLAGLAAGALWGLVFVAPRMVPAFPAVDLAAGRFLAYGAMAAAALLWRRPRRLPTRAQAGAALGLSVLGFSGYYLLVALAIRDAGTALPTLVIGTIPLWVMVLGKPGGLRWAAMLPALVLTAAGVVLMAQAAGAADGGAAARPQLARGLVLSAGALGCWTAFALLNARWLRNHPEVDVTDWANWLGLSAGVGALALWLAAGTPLAAMAATPGLPLFLLLAVGTGAGSAWLATILWNVASRRLPASLCGQLIVSETLFALAYSFAWDGRLPGPAELAACALFTCGILAAIRAHR